MADDARPIAPPDWISKTLATLDAISGYTYAALAAAAALVLFVPSPLGAIDLGPIRKDWGGWIAVCMVAFGLLAVAKIARPQPPLNSIREPSFNAMPVSSRASPNATGW
jgi:hypothetical protein